MVAKISRSAGHSDHAPPVRSLLVLMPVFAALVAKPGRAAACGPAAVVEGDAAAVASVVGLLVQRGIDTDPVGCPAVRARLERRGATIVVNAIDGDGAPPIERVVTELDAAATVIESWARTDVTSPLLAARHLRTAALPEPATAVATAVTPAAEPRVPPRGVQVFLALETSLAEDRSSWIGMQLGVCVMLGPVCAGVRGRVATTSHERLEVRTDRQATDVVFGGDIPIRLGKTTLSPGFAAGVGAVHSRVEMAHLGSETFGLRAEAHVAWTIPIWARLSIDLTATVDGTQVTDLERSNGTLSDEPRLLGRLGAGLRYGGL
jgi:hypothetical protein